MLFSDASYVTGFLEVQKSCAAPAARCLVFCGGCRISHRNRANLSLNFGRQLSGTAQHGRVCLSRGKVELSLRSNFFIRLVWIWESHSAFVMLVALRDKEDRIAFVQVVH